MMVHCNGYLKPTSTDESAGAVTYTYKHTLYACYLGYITQAIVNNLTPLLFVIFQDEFAISFEMIGRLILINFGTQIAADFFALKYVDRIGYRTAAVVAHLFCAAGLIALGILPRVMPSPYSGLVLAVVIYAIGGGIIEVMISPIVESLPGEQKASAMSLLHSFYCWGQMGVVFITTVLLWIMGTGPWFILPILWALVPIYNLIRFLNVPLLPTIPEHEKTPFRQLLSSHLFVVALILMMCAGASELTMSQWSSLFAQKGLGVPKIIGDLLGPCLFAVLMGTGRALYGVWGHRIPLKGALAASGALCVACYAVTVFVYNPVLALLGCALCGFSVALMWPGTISLSAAAFPKGGTAMFGALAIFGDVGASVGPWLAGFVSDAAQQSSRLVAWGAASGLQPEQVGLKTGLFVAMIFPLLLVAGVMLLRRQQMAAAWMGQPEQI
jgi:fucose permease